MLRQHAPQLRIRAINVVDLMALQPHEKHPHGLSDADFNALFGTDIPVIFAFHGYPWLIHRLTYRRGFHEHLHVRGYMVREYTEQYYLNMTEAYRQRCTDKAVLASHIEQWNKKINQHWNSVRLGNLETESADNRYAFTVQVYLDDLDADMVQVELYADPLDLSGDQAGPERHVMKQMERLSGAVYGYSYMTVIAAQRPISDYTVRITSFHPSAQVPLENQCILWQH